MTAEEWEKKWGSLPQEPQEPFDEKDAEIERLKALLARAAEMLETLGCKGPAVAELRKAAE